MTVTTVLAPPMAVVVRDGESVEVPTAEVAVGDLLGYNSLALPLAAGVFEPFGFTLRPEIGAISMSGSSVLVAVNALALKRLRLPQRTVADLVMR
jgi:cation transport ATPase